MKNKCYIIRGAAELWEEINSNNGFFLGFLDHQKIKNHKFDKISYNKHDNLTTLKFLNKEKLYFTLIHTGESLIKNSNKCYVKCHSSQLKLI